MDSPRGQGFHYGHMMFGWFVAPADGEYTFFTACDDACDLYMSPDEGKDHIRRIVSQRRWSGHNQWDKYVSVLTTYCIDDTRKNFKILNTNTFKLFILLD